MRALTEDTKSEDIVDLLCKDCGHFKSTRRIKMRLEDDDVSETTCNEVFCKRCSPLERGDAGNEIARKYRATGGDDHVVIASIGGSEVKELSQRERKLEDEDSVINSKSSTDAAGSKSPDGRRRRRSKSSSSIGEVAR